MSIQLTTLGRLERFQQRDELVVGLLRPLCVVQRDTGVAEPIPTDQLYEEFPNRGYVSWLTPPPAAVPGTLWEFKVTEQPFDSTKSNHDRFKVLSSPVMPYEIIDVPGVTSLECAQLFFATSGLHLPYTPTERVLLRVGHDKYVGPVHLISRDDSLLTVEVLRNSQPLPPLSVHSLRSERVVSLDCDGCNRMFVPASIKLGLPQTVVDWAPDEFVMKRVLKLAKEAHAPRFAELTKQVSDALAKLLADFGTGVDLQRLQRASAILSNAAALQQQLPLFLDELLQSPSVAAAIQEQCEIAKTKAAADLGRDFDNKRSELAALEAKIATLRGEVERCDSRLQDAESAFEARKQALEEKFRARIVELLENPGELIADATLVRALGPRQSIEPGRIDHSVTPRVGFAPPPEWESYKIAKRAATLQELKKSALSHRGDIASETIRQILATLAAGQIPIVLGTSGLKALLSVGDVVAGGRTLVVSVSPNCTEPLDVFCRAERCVSGAVRSQLLELLRGAEQEEGAFLVVLEGINRAPVESYLYPLANSYCSRFEGIERTIGFWNPSGDSQDGDDFLAHFRWPKNVWLAATAVRGPSVLPLAADILHLSTIIWSRSGTSGTSTGSLEYPPTSVTPEECKGLFKEIEPAPQVETLISALDLGGVGDPKRTERLYSRLAQWLPTDGASAITETLNIHLLPSALALDRTDAVLKAIGGLKMKDLDVEAVLGSLRPLITWK